MIIRSSLRLQNPFERASKLISRKIFSKTMTFDYSPQDPCIKLGKRETLHTYWKHFKKLCVRCLQHELVIISSTSVLLKA